MLKTRKVISLLLVVAMVAAMFVVGVVAGNAEGEENTCRYYLTGSVAGWGVDKNFQMTEVTAGEEYTLSGVALKTTDMVKAIMSNKAHDTAAEWFPDGMDNNITVDEDGMYDITFRPNGDGTAEDGYVYSWQAGEAGYEQGGGSSHYGYLLKLVKVGEYVEPETEPEATQDPDAPADPTDAPATITITVKNEAGWDGVNVYYWPNGGDWPGKAIEGDTVEIPADTAGLVFNTGSGSPQTVDVTEIADGATYTITAEAPDGKNLVNVSTPEPATEPEATEPEATEPEATEPEATEPEATEPEATEPVGGEGSGVMIDGTKYDAHVDDIIHYAFYLNLAGLPKGEGGKVGFATEIEGRVYFDKDKLELITPVEPETDEDTGIDKYATLPSLVGGSIAASNDDPAFFGYNAAKTSGYKFDSEKVLVKLDFKVKAAGESEIVNELASLGSGEFKMINGKEVIEAPVTKTVVEVECNHVTPTEPEATEPEATEPEATEPEATEPATGKSTVTAIDWNGSTDTKVVEVGDVITVTSYLKVPAGKKVNSIDFWQTFNIDAEMLELLSDVDDEDTFPNLDATANVDGNIIKANASTAKYKKAFTFDSEESILIQVKYKVVAEGNCKVKTDILTLATISEDDSMANQITEGEKVGDDEIFTKTVLDAPEHETPTEPEATEPEATEPEATEPEATEPEATEPEATEPEATEPEATEPEATEPEATEPEATEPEAFDGVLVIADGVTYAVQKDDVFTYTYYLSIPELVHSLEAQTVYMTSGLQLQSDIDDEATFPVLGEAVLANEEPAGTILYNFSSAKKGKDFTAEDSVLITVKFLVTAESGTYTIDTTVVNLAGPDEHLFIYDGEKLEDITTSESKLYDKDGVEIPPYTGPAPGEATEPEATEPEATEPEATEPEATEPEATEPEATEPEATEPEATEPEATEPEATEPEPASEPSATEPGSDTPTNPDSPKTGSTEIALIFLMVLVLSAGVVVFVKKRRFN